MWLNTLPIKKCRKSPVSLKNNRMAYFEILLETRYLIQYKDKLIIRQTFLSLSQIYFLVTTERDCKS